MYWIFEKQLQKDDKNILLKNCYILTKNIFSPHEKWPLKYSKRVHFWPPSLWVRWSTLARKTCPLGIKTGLRGCEGYSPAWGSPGPQRVKTMGCKEGQLSSCFIVCLQCQSFPWMKVVSSRWEITQASLWGAFNLKWEPGTEKC